jgi:predicted phosphodiesterase
VRYLILSDIHANLEALDAVLADARGAYDRIACCGDLVGYGADPNAVCDWTRANLHAVVRGNHDKACACPAGAGWFNARAQASAAWTRAALSSENLAYVCALPQGPAEIVDARVVHGSPLDEDEYVLSEREAARAASHLAEGIYFFGHSHLQGGFLGDWKGVRPLPRPDPCAAERTLALEPGRLYLINPGAVGQPRDGDPRAGYAIYRSEARVVHLRRVAYDIQRAQTKIHQAGLPMSLADRLAAGR